MSRLLNPIMVFHDVTFKTLCVCVCSTGPAFNLFLRLCDFKIGPFVVNKFTAPGVSTKYASTASHSIFII